MHRFFSSLAQINKGTIILSDKKQAHHIRDVLRLKLKDEVAVFDARGNEYLCAIKEISAGYIALEIKNTALAQKRPALPRLTVACAIPKKAKMDEIIAALTQLGVDKIIPLLTQRVVVRLAAEKYPSRLMRWQKIAVAASEQCRRCSLPAIDEPMEIREVLAQAKDYDLRIIPSLMAKSISLKEAMRKKRPRNILVLIGPEGDFTPQELKEAARAGFIPLTLGELVLRVDIAAIAVAAYIRLSSL